MESEDPKHPLGFHAEIALGVPSVAEWDLVPKARFCISEPKQGMSPSKPID